MDNFRNYIKVTKARDSTDVKFDLGDRCCICRHLSFLRSEHDTLVESSLEQLGNSNGLDTETSNTDASNDDKGDTDDNDGPNNI